MLAQTDGGNFTKLVDDVVEATDELIRFWRSKGQGQDRYSLEGQTFEWVIAADGGIQIDSTVRVEVRDQLWAESCRKNFVIETKLTQYSAGRRPQK